MLINALLLFHSTTDNLEDSTQDVQVRTSVHQHSDQLIKSLCKRCSCTAQGQTSPLERVTDLAPQCRIFTLYTHEK